jgi:hypothetical protein
MVRRRQLGSKCDPKRYLAIYDTGTVIMRFPIKNWPMLAPTPQVIGQRIQYFEGSERITGNSDITRLGCRRFARHDQVSCVTMIGLPICVRELKIDLVIFMLRKGNRDGGPV